MSAHRLGFLLFEGCQGLDLFGPLDAFSIAADHADGPYEWSTIAVADGPIRTESGVQILADCLANERPRVDTLIVPGGRGARECELDKTTVDDLRWIAGRAERVVSICTGAFLLARLGLSEGKTIHHPLEVRGGVPAQLSRLPGRSRSSLRE
ncbi:MAG: DJ-1/PfpI family protein [Sphingomicrobium sp.]